MPISSGAESTSSVTAQSRSGDPRELLLSRKVASTGGLPISWLSRGYARTNGIRLWQSRTCATLTIVVTPLSRMRIFEDLRGLGYAGGYDAVRRYAASVSRSRLARAALAASRRSSSARHGPNRGCGWTVRS
jgi:hypothetical protein